MSKKKNRRKRKTEEFHLNAVSYNGHSLLFYGNPIFKVELADPIGPENNRYCRVVFRETTSKGAVSYLCRVPLSGISWRDLCYSYLCSILIEEACILSSRPLISTPLPNVVEFKIEYDSYLSSEIEDKRFKKFLAKNSLLV